MRRATSVDGCAHLGCHQKKPWYSPAFNRGINRSSGNRLLAGFYVRGEQHFPDRLQHAQGKLPNMAAVFEQERKLFWPQLLQADVII